MKAQVHNLILDALQSAQNSGDVKMIHLPEIVVEEPRDSKLGDFATNVAMTMAKNEGKNPRVIADAICKKLKNASLVCRKL